MGIIQGIKNAAITTAVGVEALGPGVPAVTSQLDLSEGLRTATNSLVDSSEEAIEAGVEGQVRGADAASSEPVPEATASDTSDPPEGWAESFLSWSEGDALESTLEVEPAESDGTDGGDGEGFGGG